MERFAHWARPKLGLTGIAAIAVNVRRSRDAQIESGDPQGDATMWQVMDMPERPIGLFDARYRTFLATVLFRIAHNRCIDFLRRRNARERAESAYWDDIGVIAHEPATSSAHRAIERLVGHLPPKERACILLKDVFDYSLEETAELVDSTVGGVKSALSRGRAKLADLPAETTGDPGRQLDPETAQLLCLGCRSRPARRSFPGS